MTWQLQNDTELTSLHYLKLLQWFKESDLVKLKVFHELCTRWNKCELDHRLANPVNYIFS